MKTMEDGGDAEEGGVVVGDEEDVVVVMLQSEGAWILAATARLQSTERQRWWVMSMAATGL